MKGMTKKIIASALAIVLVLAMGTTCFGASWKSYFGATDNPSEDPEGAAGRLAKNSATAWTANVELTGWNGVWGGQVYKPAGSVNIAKGKVYQVQFTAKSTRVTKYVYLKIAKGESLAHGEWLKLQKGKNIKVNKAFKAPVAANSVYFGIGGDMGNDNWTGDFATRYAIFDKQYGKGAHLNLATLDATGDAASVISVTGFKLGAAKVTGVKAKAGKKKVTVSFSKMNGASKYQVKAGSKKVTTKKTKAVVKKLKSKKKVKVQVRANVGGTWTGWSAAKKVKVK